MLRFPGSHYGIDPYYHVYVSKMILSGGIPTYNPYHFYGTLHDYPPLFHFVIASFIYLFGEKYSPMVSSILGALTTVLMYKIGEKLKRGLGIIAGFFFSVIPLDLTYTNSYLRPDSLSILLISAEILVILRLLHSENKKDTIWLSVLLASLLGLHSFSHKSWILVYLLILTFSIGYYVMYFEIRIPISLISSTVLGYSIGSLLYLSICPWMFHGNMVGTVEGLLSTLSSIEGESRSVAFQKPLVAGMFYYMSILPLFAWIFGLASMFREIHVKKYFFLMYSSLFFFFSYSVAFRMGAYFEVFLCPIAAIGVVKFWELIRELRIGEAQKFLLRLLVFLLMILTGIHGVISVAEMKPTIPREELALVELASEHYRGRSFSLWDRGHLLAYYGFSTFVDGYPSLENSAVYDEIMWEVIRSRERRVAIDALENEIKPDIIFLDFRIEKWNEDLPRWLTESEKYYLIGIALEENRTAYLFLRCSHEGGCCNTCIR